MKKNKVLALALVTTIASVASVNAFAGGNIEAGKVAAAKFNCAACHGDDYNTTKDAAYPKLAGQHKDYLEHALVAYQRGGSVANGRANAIMAGQAKQLSRQDIQNIAAYLHSLPGSLVLRR